MHREMLPIGLQRYLITAFGVLVLFSRPTLSGDETKIRTWTDHTGHFQTEAKLVDIKNGEVALMKSTGEVVRVPWLNLNASGRSLAQLDFGVLSGETDVRASVNRGLGSVLQGESGNQSKLSLEHQQTESDASQAEPLLQTMSESELSRELAAQTPELSLFPTTEAATTFIASIEPKHDSQNRKRVSRRHVAIRNRLLKQPEISSLPLRPAHECRLSTSELTYLDQVSLGFGKAQLKIPSADSAAKSDKRADERNQKIVSFIRGRKSWHNDDAVPALVQVLQPEGSPARRELIEILSQLVSQRSSTVLAQRAVFDLSASNRAVAIDALRARPAEEYRDVFIDALRYPWLPVAQHAAEALVRLDARDAVDELTELLNEQNPCAPYRTDDGKYAVRELVKVNHFKNCLLCHQASTKEVDLVRGSIPYPDRRIPSKYYQRSSRSGSFVRADVTFLRQDFSVNQRVVDPQPWPTVQRFDYLVRTRSLSAEEAANCSDRYQRAANPHRDAVSLALRMLRDDGNVSPQEMRQPNHSNVTTGLN